MKIFVLFGGKENLHHSLKAQAFVLLHVCDLAFKFFYFYFFFFFNLIRK